MRREPLQRRDLRSTLALPSAASTSAHQATIRCTLLGGIGYVRACAWPRCLRANVRFGSRPCENPIGAMVSLAESRGDDEGFCSRGGSPADDAVAGMP